MEEYDDDESYILGIESIVVEEIQSILNNCECSSIVTVGANNSILTEEELQNSDSFSVIRPEYLHTIPDYCK